MTPSDPSNLERWHHLQRHCFWNLRSPDRQWRRDRFHGHKIILRVAGPTCASLVDLDDGGLVGNPSTMKMPMSYTGLTEVLVVLPTDPHHLFLETRELVFEVFEFVLQNVQLSRLLAHYLRQIVGLEKPSSAKCLANQDIAKEAP